MPRFQYSFPPKLFAESWQMLRKGWWWRGRASEQARRRKGRGGHFAPRPPAALTGPGAQFLSTRLCWVKGQLGPSRSALGRPDQAHRQTASSDNPRPAAAGVEWRGASSYRLSLQRVSVVHLGRSHHLSLSERACDFLPHWGNKVRADIEERLAALLGGVWAEPKEASGRGWALASAKNW